MTPETLRLAQRAEKARTEGVRLCQEAISCRRLLESQKAASARLKGDVGTELDEFLCLAGHIHRPRRV